MKYIKLWTLTLMFLLAMTMQAADKQKLEINGEVVEKVVTRITFEGDDLVLTFEDSSCETADMESVKLSFVLDDISAINTLKKQVDTLLDIAGIEPGTEVVVYDVQGKMVLSAKAADARLTLHTHFLPSGIYVMKAGKQVVKFVKR